MVLLVHKLNIFHKHPSKLENHCHHHHHCHAEAYSASLQAFYSDVSNCMSTLLPNSDLGSEFMSLMWLQQCFEKLPIVHKAFTKLMVEIDYPISKWEASSIQEYLNYTLNLLEFLNSITSALSQLHQNRVALSHSLNINKDSLKKLKPVEEIHAKDVKWIEESKQSISTEKGLILHQALVVLKSTGLWICSVLLTGLCSDRKPYLETRKSLGEFGLPILHALDSRVCEEMTESKGLVKEVREVNEAVCYLVEGKGKGETVTEVAEVLKGRLAVIESVLTGVEEEGNQLFAEVMAGRNEVLDILRQQM